MTFASSGNNCPSENGIYQPHRKCAVRTKIAMIGKIILTKHPAPTWIDFLHRLFSMGYAMISVSLNGVGNPLL